jgi:TnpA family transposase
LEWAEADTLAAMSAANQLTDQQRSLILTGHHAFRRREMVRHWMLSEHDLEVVNERRQRHNRLGFAVQLCLLRYPGWPLKPGEIPPSNLLEYAAEQLCVDPEEITEYPKRDRTRREHVQWLARTYDFHCYYPPYPQMLHEHLRQEALSTDSSFALVQSSLDWLRSRKIIPPALTTLETAARSIRGEVERTTFQSLEDRLTGEQKRSLDGMLDIGPRRGSVLGWLRRVPRSCSAPGIVDLIQRIEWARERRIPKEVVDSLSAAKLRQLAGRGARHSVSHFRHFPDRKRHAILAAFVLYMVQELTDRVIDFHNRLIGRMFHQAEKNRWAEFVDSGSRVNEKLHNYSRLSKAITAARREKRDFATAIEAVISWEALEQDGQEAARLAKPLDSSDYDRFRAHFPQFRQYTPKFLETFEFEAIAAFQPVLNALEVLRKMNRESLGEVPKDAPRSFVKQKWGPYVFTAKGIDRCYYELCALSELSLGLKSGDIWIRDSLRYREFDSYLLAPAVWTEQKSKLLDEDERLADCEAYLADRKERLHEQMNNVAELIRKHELPEARLEGNRLVLSPLSRYGPDLAEQWAEKVYAVLPRIQLTHLLQEVDGWTNFTSAFTHLYTGKPVADKIGALTAVLADATGLGNGRMAEATEGYTADRLDWLDDWFIREPTYAAALAKLVTLQSQIPLVEHWGSGRTSSSDGQAFPIGFRKPVIAQVNAKYGRDPVTLVYTHISDRYAPFHAKSISSTVRDATHVLDGLLNHRTEIQTDEHYTDTSGYTEHIFALCHALGLRFAPRIRDLGDHRLFCFEKPSEYGVLKPLIGGRVHVKTVRDNWDEYMRLTASLRLGTASPSLLIGKLAGYPRQSRLAGALREVGRIERTLFTLEWLQNPELRRRVTIGLNKGEAHHTLKRAIRFYRKGSISDRTRLEQDIHAMALNLVVAAITLWNTAYLDRALRALQERGTPVPDIYLPHISPLGWEHITITGTYLWKGSTAPWGRFRPLRLEANRQEPRIA